MNVQTSVRKEREALYITKMIELQKHWGNPMEENAWDDLGEWTDEELEEGIKNVTGQLSFEKRLVPIFKIAVMAVVILILGYFLMMNN